MKAELWMRENAEYLREQKGKPRSALLSHEAGSHPTPAGPLPSPSGQVPPLLHHPVPLGPPSWLTLTPICWPFRERSKNRQGEGAGHLQGAQGGAPTHRDQPPPKPRQAESSLVGEKRPAQGPPRTLPHFCDPGKPLAPLLCHWGSVPWLSFSEWLGGDIWPHRDMGSSEVSTQAREVAAASENTGHLWWRGKGARQRAPGDGVRMFCHDRGYRGGCWVGVGEQQAGSWPVAPAPGRPCPRASHPLRRPAGLQEVQLVFLFSPRSPVSVGSHSRHAQPGRPSRGCWSRRRSLAKSTTACSAASTAGPCRGTHAPRIGPAAAPGCCPPGKHPLPGPGPTP